MKKKVKGISKRKVVLRLEMMALKIILEKTQVEYVEFPWKFWFIKKFTNLGFVNIIENVDVVGIVF